MPMQDLSEVGHQTHESPALSQYQLKSDALKVEPGIAGYPDRVSRRLRAG